MRRRRPEAVKTLLLCSSFLYLCLFPAWATCLAAPAVTSFTGSVNHKDSGTILGSGFGSKPTAPPLAWEDFSSGTLTGALNANAINLFNNTDNLRTPYSPYNARFDFKSGGNGFFSYNGKSASRWFVQYWIKLAPNWHWGTTTHLGEDDGLANIKFWRVFPLGEHNYSNNGYNFHGWQTGDNVMRFFEKNTNDDVYLYNFNMQSVFTLDAWHSVQVQYAENTGIDQYDGQIKLWIDGRLMDSSSSINTNCGLDATAKDKRPYIIGFFDAWPPSHSPEQNQYAYYCDVYVDNTWSRVEIGNNPDYSACTHRELQIPTAWSNNSIAITMNLGSFAPGENLYLFVVNADGVVNKEGYPLGSLSNAALTPPTHLRLIH